MSNTTIKTFHLTVDEYEKELLLTAIMEKAQNSKDKVKEAYLRLYGDIKESIMNQ